MKVLSKFFSELRSKVLSGLEIAWRLEERRRAIIDFVLSYCEVYPQWVDYIKGSAVLVTTDRILVIKDQDLPSEYPVVTFIAHSEYHGRRTYMFMSLKTFQADWNSRFEKLRAFYPSKL